MSGHLPGERGSRQDGACFVHSQKKPPCKTLPATQQGTLELTDRPQEFPPSDGNRSIYLHPWPSVCAHWTSLARRIHTVAYMQQPYNVHCRCIKWSFPFSTQPKPQYHITTVIRSVLRVNFLPICQRHQLFCFLELCPDSQCR